MGKVKGEVKMATVALGTSLTSRWKIKLGAVDDREAVLVMGNEQDGEPGRSDQMMMAT